MPCIRNAALYALLFLYIHLQAQPDSIYVDDPPAISISFVGNGDFQKALLGQTDIQASMGLGLIFRRLWPKNYWLDELMVDLSISSAPSADTLGWDGLESPLDSRRQMGSYLLDPGNARQSANFGLRAYFSPKNPKRWWTTLLSGLEGRLRTSNSVLHHGADQIHFSGLSARLGFFHDFMPAPVRRERGYSLTLGAHYAFRGLLGDLSSSENDCLRRQLLGTARTAYHGLEVTFGFRLQNIRAEVQIPILMAGKAHLPGLTDAQMITSLGFVGGFPIEIERHERR